MDEVKLVDTTLRDGAQSLWACRMRVGAMLPAMADIDAAGYDGIEFATSTGHFQRAVRDLKENPWDWLRLGSQNAPSGRLRLHGGIVPRFGTEPFPRCLQEVFLARLSEMGIRVTRTSDPWNNFTRLEETLAVMRRFDIETVVNIVYSVSPRHTNDYYAKATREAVKISPHRVCFKDVGGMLTPERARELVPIVLANAGDTPVELHIHCNNGQGPYVALVAVDAGIRIVHTAIPPLANGFSQPSVFDIAANLRMRGYQVDVDTDRLRVVSEHFDRVAAVENMPKGVPARYQESLYRHQVPGGMISNLQFQMEQLGHGDKLPEALEEVVRVREELGYPIMVTPLAQFVGSQAVLNVLSNERYSTVSDDIIQYALGGWGSEAPEVMDQDVRQLIVDRPRTAAVAAKTVEEPSMADLRRRYGSTLSDEELVVRVFGGIEDPWSSFASADSFPRTYADYVSAHANPIQTLLQGFEERPSVRTLRVRRKDWSLDVRRPA